MLLRHGQTVWSESGQHTGRTNIPLTDIGCDQARAAGERLRETFPPGFSRKGGCSPSLVAQSRGTSPQLADTSGRAPLPAWYRSSSASAGVEDALSA